LEPALGPERAGLWPKILAAHRQPQTRGDLDAGGQSATGDLDRLEQQPGRDRQRRADPQQLLDDRFEIGGVVIGEARVYLGMARKALKRPRKRGGGAVMPAY